MKAIVSRTWIGSGHDVITKYVRRPPFAPCLGYWRIPGRTFEHKAHATAGACTYTNTMIWETDIILSFQNCSESGEGMHTIPFKRHESVGYKRKYLYAACRVMPYMLLTDVTNVWGVFR